MIAKRPQADEAGKSSSAPFKLDGIFLVRENLEHQILAQKAYVKLSHASQKPGSKKKIKAIKAEMERIGDWLHPEAPKS